MLTFVHPSLSLSQWNTLKVLLRGGPYFPGSLRPGKISSSLIYLHLVSLSSPIFVILVHNGGTWTYAEQHRACTPSVRDSYPSQENCSPEIQIIDRSLLVAHINVEEEQVDRSQSPSTQHLEKSWQSVPIHVWLWRWCLGSVLHLEDFLP